jgi:hypothetical protein
MVEEEVQRKMVSGGNFRQCSDHGQQFTTSADQVEAIGECITAIVVYDRLKKHFFRMSSPHPCEHPWDSVEQV